MDGYDLTLNVRQLHLVSYRWCSSKSDRQYQGFLSSCMITLWELSKLKKRWITLNKQIIAITLQLALLWYEFSIRVGWLALLSKPQFCLFKRSAENIFQTLFFTLKLFVFSKCEGAKSRPGGGFLAETKVGNLFFSIRFLELFFYSAKILANYTAGSSPCTNQQKYPKSFPTHCSVSKICE